MSGAEKEEEEDDLKMLTTTLEPHRSMINRHEERVRVRASKEIQFKISDTSEKRILSGDLHSTCSSGVANFSNRKKSLI